MFVQSGVRDIISKLKRKIGQLRIFRSLRFRIFFLVTVAGIVPCVLLSLIIMHSYESRAVSVRTSTVRNQCMVLANHLLNYDYLENQSIETINAELEQLSSLYNGRVLIMNSDYRIIKDTYGISEGKYMISEEVVRTFKRENVSTYDGKNKYIEVTTPIIVNTVQDSGRSDEQGNVVGVMLTSVSTEEIAETISMLWRISHIITSVAVILIIVCSYIASTRLVRPFDVITNSIDEIQEGFEHREMTVNDYLETEKITTAFNHLLGRMQALDDSRQEFVSNVSHELKTPITSVKVLADSLLQQGDGVPAEMYREFMEDIVHEIDRENDIINDLLTLVRMDKKDASLNPQKCDMEELIESIIKRLDPIAQKNQIEVYFETVRDVVADVDRTKMSLAITNLIENGIKYNNPGGRVVVRLDAEPLMFVLEVSDTGMGIPEESLPNIFERFYRVEEEARSRASGGTGLGLSITKEIIRAHGENINVISTEGVGTEFIFSLPVSSDESEEEI